MAYYKFKYYLLFIKNKRNKYKWINKKMINYYGLEILHLFKYKNKDNISKNIVSLVWKE